MSNTLTEVYAVRNKEGQWFHRKGYSGYGSTWVNDIKKARIYTKTGGARSVISWFAERYSEYGIPDLIILKVTDMEVVDESERIANKKTKKEAAIKRKEENRERAEYERLKRKFE